MLYYDCSVSEHTFNPEFYKLGWRLAFIAFVVKKTDVLFFFHIYDFLLQESHFAYPALR